MEMLNMKKAYVGLMMCAVALAQTNSAALPSQAAKGTATKTTAAAVRKAAAPTAKSAATKTTAPTAPATKGAPAVRMNLLEPSSLNAKAPALFRARLNTSKGPVVIEVTRAWSPHGADRFYNLVRAGFFTDLYFFRVVAGFMAQFGMSSRPDVSRAWFQETIPDDPALQSNTRGMVTFAKSGAPNSRSTQFFINYGDNSRLDATGFAPFGKVIEGMEIVDTLYSGYGEQSNNQEAIRTQGKAFFGANYPLLDKIVSANIVPPVPAAPAAPKPPVAGGSGAAKARAVPAATQTHAPTTKK
jgi:peptidyl-prolyl cis-trans isomerase A (cyclophilin A)